MTDTERIMRIYEDGYKDGFAAGKFVGREISLKDVREEAEKIAVKLWNQKLWIPVKQRLPKKDGWYHVTARRFDKTTVATHDMYFEDGEWASPWYEVIAWMKKPEPYTEEEDES